MLPLVVGESTGPAGGLRERKKQQVRDAIVDAALDLFSRDGYDTTTVQAIADRASVSSATVARYFPSKEALLFAERDVRVAALRAAIVARPRREPALRAVIGALVEQTPLDDTGRSRLLRSRQAIARSTVLRGQALGVLDVWRSCIADAIAEREGLDPETARVLATAVVAILDDATDRWAATNGTDDLRTNVRRAFGILERATTSRDE
jgi:AcrR family transcriptional regulator